VASAAGHSELLSREYFPPRSSGVPFDEPAFEKDETTILAEHSTARDRPG
jgi:hypothetical protein